MALLVGQMVNHYRILEHLGGGGMGVVFKAHDTRLERPVVLKFLPSALTGDTEANGRFIREGRAASALQHPNICVVHDIDEAPDGQLFICMEYLEGEMLRRKIDGGGMAIEEAIDIAIQVAEGLVTCHEHGIIHRDIKPANIMITREGVAKIVDFGLAKLLGETLLSRTGSTAGTVAYMSPEQALGGHVDQRTDIWSLGVVLYEMLSGRRPFASEVEEALIYAIRTDDPLPLRRLRSEIPGAVEEIVRKALAKRPERRYPSVAAMLQDLREYQKSSRPSLRELSGVRRTIKRAMRPHLAIPVILLLCMLAGACIWQFDRQAKIRWAKEEILPRATMLKRFDEDIWDNVQSYHLAELAERYIPGDPLLVDLLSKLSVTVSVRTEPSGARLFLKEYGAPDSSWRLVGLSPLERMRMPIWYYELRMEKDGYEPVHAAFLTAGFSRKGWIPDTIVRRLDAAGGLPAGMIRIPGNINIPGVGPLGDFCVDRCEVTNKSFKAFVDQGGYRKKEYWKQPFFKEGKALSWESAVRQFVDQTGRPGPSTWEAGDYPAGQESYPVSGVSWYEAAAYAEFAEKALPTVYHWDLARGKYTRIGQSPYFPILFLGGKSNFRGMGSAPVGSFSGVTAYGGNDMAGNVREWGWNDSQKGKSILGGAWNNMPYMFEYWSQASPWDRSPTNGFRCIRSLVKDGVPEAALRQVRVKELRNFSTDAPVSDAVFRTYKEQFAYDKIPLDGRVEWRTDSSAGWIHEKVSFNAAYEKERVSAHLFLPRNAHPPYQTVVFFPAGFLAAMMRSSEDMEHYRDFTLHIRFLLQNGRAVLYPIYKGTFERGSDEFLRIHTGDTTHAYTDLLVKIVKDFRRSMDYLETRAEIDTAKLAYFGFSWGGYYGAIIPALEERLKVSILEMGGFWDFSRPEANEFNYVTHVKLPTLMLNGKYDTVFPFDVSVKPMFARLGTSAKHKRLVLYDTDHYVPQNELIKETLGWLDRYLGPVH